MGRLIGRMLGSAPAARSALAEAIVTVVSYDAITRTCRVNHRGAEVAVPTLGDLVPQPGQTARLLLVGPIPSGVAPL